MAIINYHAIYKINFIITNGNKLPDTIPMDEPNKIQLSIPFYFLYDNLETIKNTENPNNVEMPIFGNNPNDLNVLLRTTRVLLDIVNRYFLSLV